LRSENIVVTGYISDEELGQYYRTIRLVVAPLRYGAGVKGKIIEALYNRTPVITTTIGAEGVPGIENLVSIADDAEKFAAAVCHMYKDKSMWTAQMEAAAPFICRNFSKKLAKQILLLDIDLKSAEHS
jgi:glycosyltransferase involved in cell wall biosynthesis